MLFKIKIRIKVLITKNTINNIYIEKLLYNIYLFL